MTARDLIVYGKGFGTCRYEGAATGNQPAASSKHDLLRAIPLPGILQRRRARRRPQLRTQPTGVAPSLPSFGPRNRTQTMRTPGYQEIPNAIQDFADLLSAMQRKRHYADYDPAKTYNAKPIRKSEVVQDILDAEERHQSVSGRTGERPPRVRYFRATQHQKDALTLPAGGEPLERRAEAGSTVVAVLSSFATRCSEVRIELRGVVAGDEQVVRTPGRPARRSWTNPSGRSRSTSTRRDRHRPSSATAGTAPGCAARQGSSSRSKSCSRPVCEYQMYLRWAVGQVVVAQLVVVLAGVLAVQVLAHGRRLSAHDRQQAPARYRVRDRRSGDVQDRRHQILQADRRRRHHAGAQRIALRAADDERHARRPLVGPGLPEHVMVPEHLTVVGG